MSANSLSASDPVYTIEPVVKTIDNRLYRVNGVSVTIILDPVVAVACLISDAAVFANCALCCCVQWNRIATSLRICLTSYTAYKGR